MEPDFLRSMIQKNSHDGRLFRYAAEEGCLSMVDLFLQAKNLFQLTSEELEKCSNEGAADNDGTTPLHIAASKGHCGVVECIIRLGESVNTENLFKETPLYMASREGYAIVVRELLKAGADPFVSAIKDRKTAIDIATSNGHTDIAETLLKSSAGSVRALLYAVSEGHTDTVSLVLRLNVESAPSEVALQVAHQIAVSIGHTDIVRLLEGANTHVASRANEASAMNDAAEREYIEFVQSVLCGDYLGVSPLHRAVLRKYMSYVQLLLKWNIEVNVLNPYGDSPLDLAVRGGERDIALLLHSHGALLGSKGHFLHTAAEKGQSLAMLSLFALGANPHTPCPLNGFTPLHVACRQNHLEVVQLLLQKNVSVNALDHDHNTPLHLACKNYGGESVVKLLIEHGAMLNVRNHRYNVPLHSAEPSKIKGISALLKAYGALITSFNKIGRTPLDLARTFSIQKLLIESGADPNIVDEYGQTLLHKTSNIKLMRLLLENNVLVEARDRDRNTPLHLACMNGQKDIVVLLIEYGASVNAKSRETSTPLYMSLLERKYEIAKILLENEADPNAIAGLQGATELHLVTERYDIEGTLLLLENGAAVNAKDHFGNTALHRATECISVLKVLLDFGAKPNLSNELGKTPLFYTTDIGTTEMLLKYGADLTIRDKDRKTALDWAEHYEEAEIVAVLKKHASKNSK